jgi:cystathionine beta-lyase/cystathionine gamma-synthase
MHMTMSAHSHGSHTRAVHAGETPDPTTGSLVPPIHQTSVFVFRDTEHMHAVFSGRTPGNIYTRYGNPTQRAVEEKVAALEGAEDALVFSSGTAAILTAVLTAVQPGQHLVSARDIYGGTFEIFRDLLPRFGVEVTFVDVRDTDAMASAVRPNTRMLYVESPTNPTLRLADLAAVAGVARECGLVSVIDNTFASPAGQTPLQFGLDVVVHSATKYLGGHSDLSGGVLVAKAAFVEKARTLRRTMGGVLDPHASWLLLRGLRTLALRVERQSANALALARHLEQHPGVEAVYYPGLVSHPQHALAQRQMRLFGGMLSFDVRGTAGTTARVVDGLRLATLAPSLGGVETLVVIPALSSHRQFSLEDRALAGVRDTTVRLSVGIEDVDDLIRDLDGALRAAGAGEGRRENVGSNAGVGT